MKESKVIFDAKKLAAEIMKNVSAEQTNRLIEYAKQTILEIGNKIQTYHSRNHMYRSGHLLRSLCCGVSYDGKLVVNGTNSNNETIWLYASTEEFILQNGEEYIVNDIVTDDEELNSFLFSLGCYSGEPITVISHLKGGCVVAIKDSRYNIDNPQRAQLEQDLFQVLSQLQ